MNRDSNCRKDRVERPNEETRKAMEEVNAMIREPEKYPAYTDVHKLFRDLLA